MLKITKETWKQNHQEQKHARSRVFIYLHRRCSLFSVGKAGQDDESMSLKRLLLHGNELISIPSLVLLASETTLYFMLCIYGIISMLMLKLFLLLKVVPERL